MNFDNWLCKQTGHWANFSIQTLKRHREIETVGARMCAKISNH